MRASYPMTTGGNDPLVESGMKIESEHLVIELEPELLTDEQLRRVERLIQMLVSYEEAKVEREAGFEDDDA